MNDGDLVMVRVLGPVDIHTRRGRVAIGSRFGRKLLATLALSANHLLTLEQIALILWDDAPPPSRDNTLHTYVSRLRHLLGPDRILGEEHSYQLQVAIEELDALLFESLVAEAVASRLRPEECLELCKRSLGLWRGVPFGEFAGEDPFRLEAIRLDELRLFVMELKMESELSLGREEMVIGALEGMVEEYPYRERVWYLLMSALSMAGRRVEALRAGRRLRHVLGEVGLAPSWELQELEERILAEDPEVRFRLWPAPH